MKRRIKELIIKVLTEKRGRITFDKTNDDEYPLTILLAGKKDIYSISITDVYLDENESIYVDGIDDDTSYKKKDFMISEDQYSDILYFIGYTLDWLDPHIKQLIIDDTNSTIMELACQLAEKEMFDSEGWTIESLMDETGEKYTEAVQEKFNPLYDKYYNQITTLANFELRSV